MFCFFDFVLLLHKFDVKDWVKQWQRRCTRDHRCQSSCTSMIGVLVLGCEHVHQPCITVRLWHVAAYVMTVTVAVILGVLSDRRQSVGSGTALVVANQSASHHWSPSSTFHVNDSTLIVTWRRVVHSWSCLLVSTFILLYFPYVNICQHSCMYYPHCIFDYSLCIVISCSIALWQLINKRICMYVCDNKAAKWLNRGNYWQQTLTYIIY